DLVVLAGGVEVHEVRHARAAAALHAEAQAVDRRILLLRDHQLAELLRSLVRHRDLAREARGRLDLRGRRLGLRAAMAVTMVVPVAVSLSFLTVSVTAAFTTASHREPPSS